MRLPKSLFLLLVLSLLISCSSTHKSNGNIAIKNRVTETEYLPSKIFIDNYRLIGNKDVLNIKTVNYGTFFSPHKPPIVSANYKIKPSKEDWKSFWESLNALGVWQWKSKYYSPRTEGWVNRIVLIYPNKRIDVSIISKNPENYPEFLKAVDKLTKYKQNSLTRKQFMQKLNKQKQHNKSRSKKK